MKFYIPLTILVLALSLNSGRKTNRNKKWSKNDDYKQKLKSLDILDNYNEFNHLIDYSKESDSKIIEQLEIIYEKVKDESSKCAKFVKKTIEESKEIYHDLFENDKTDATEYYFKKLQDLYNNQIGKFLDCIIEARKKRF